MRGATGHMGTDFTRGKVTGLLLRFLGPFLLANLLNSIYNTVDMIIIGRYVGSVGTVAVSLGGKMLTLLTGVSTGLAGGGQILIAQQTGAGRRRETTRTIGTLFSLLGIISAVLCAVCLVFSRQILLWLNTPADSFGAALGYLRVTCLGLPLIFGYNAVSSVLHGMGDSRNPLLFIAIAALVNLVLDLVFIVGLSMGAVGTALATVIGQGVSFAFSVALLYRRRERFGFDFKLRSFAVHRDKMRVILRIGVPMAAQSGLIQITQLFMMGFVNLYGLVQAAAYGVGDKILHLTNVVCQSTYQAAGSMVAQNIGAGLLDRARKVVRSSLLVTFSVSSLLALLSVCFPRLVFSLFTADEAVLAYAVRFMRISALTYLLSAYMSGFNAVITGTGNAKLAFLSGFLDGVVFRVAFSLFFAYTLNMEVTGFFLGNNLARLGPILVGSIYYFSGAWTRRGTLVQKDTPAPETEPEPVPKPSAAPVHH